MLSSCFPFPSDECLRNTGQNRFISNVCQSVPITEKSTHIRISMCLHLKSYVCGGKFQFSWLSSSIWGTFGSIFQRHKRAEQTQLWGHDFNLTPAWHTRNCALNNYVKWNIGGAAAFISNKVVILKHLDSEWGNLTTDKKKKVLKKIPNNLLFIYMQFRNANYGFWTRWIQLRLKRNYKR